MRTFCGGWGPALLVTAGFLGSLVEATSADEPVQPADSAQQVRDLARRYQFFTDAGRTTRFELSPKSLLTYSNPVRGDVFGNLFVWTHDGRPEVVGAIFDYRTEGHFDSELHTLARAGIAGERDGVPFWNPRAPGVAFQPLAEAPAPADKGLARGRQMAELARSFTVERQHPEQGRGEMRLLPQPVYRYSSPGAKVVDGAMFVFVEATDPEAILLLEAVGDEPKWQFAFARMNIVPFRALRHGEEAWHVDDVTWDEVFDKEVPYAIVREKPSRGLTRTR